jgi:3-hydroxyacyl-CoA dehydrogenase/enoyl-CoA hydratase/3-hydroxybutyryl-CoA epimerase
MDRLQPDYQGQGVQRADVVIEAIYENLEAKQSLYKRIEPHLAEHAVLATNTSSIPLETLSTCLAQPERLVGMHFFNPVAKMQLVEVVSSANTGLACQQKVTRFTRQIGRLPLPVKSNPGFLVNRILMPYLLEAVVLVEEGIDPKEVDFVAKEFGMPMGPIELADTVGLDICLSVATMLAPEFGLNVPASLKDKVEQGYLGRKNGQGFYRYPEQKQLLKTRHDEVDHHLIEQRLILRLVNECISCLAEGIVDDRDLLDAGVVFGTGFAPFRGGPIRYLQQHGSKDLLLQLNNLHQRFGQRFEPKPGWENIS